MDYVNVSAELRAFLVDHRFRGGRSVAFGGVMDQEIAGQQADGVSAL